MALIIFVVPTLHLNAFSASESSTNLMGPEIWSNDLIGAWHYTVDSAPPEYSKGVISISKIEGSYEVQIQLAAGILKGEKVEVDGNTVNFNLFIEGGSVNVVLTADGKTITGQSSGPDGSVYTIKGNRVEPE